MDILQAKDRGVIGGDSSAAVHSSAKLHTFEGRKSNKAREKAMTGVFLICGLIAIAFVITISGFLIISGLPAIGQIGFSEFMFGTKWASTAATPSYGILPFILTSIYGTAGAILIAVPIGLLCAVYLAKFAGEHVAVVIRSSVELLAGIPSVVYGLVGMIVIVPFVREAFSLPDGANLFSAILVLSVMVLPTVISQSETALLAVPTEYEEASLSLGATWTETVFKVSVPAAKSGIASAVVLGVGRAIGEAMAVMMVSGNVANMPGLFRSVRFLTTAVASEMSYSSGLQKQALFSIALILFVFIMIITLLLNFVFKKKEKDS
jgi:phosphate transport system permease protein